MTDTPTDGEDDRPSSALYEAFLRGERTEDVLIYLHEDGIGSMDDLLEIGTRVDDGAVLVLPGKEGKSAFQSATGLDAMDFAGTAMQTNGNIDDDCQGGTCPSIGEKADGTEDHYIKFVFAFAEEQNEGVGGIYAEGDVIHGYAACACGTTFSDKWVVDS